MLVEGSGHEVRERSVCLQGDKREDDGLQPRGWRRQAGESDSFSLRSADLSKMTFNRRFEF